MAASASSVAARATAKSGRDVRSKKTALNRTDGGNASTIAFATSRSLAIPAGPTLRDRSMSSSTRSGAGLSVTASGRHTPSATAVSLPARPTAGTRPAAARIWSGKWAGGVRSANDTSQAARAGARPFARTVPGPTRADTPATSRSASRPPAPGATLTSTSAASGSASSDPGKDSTKRPRRHASGATYR
jgi:hypothetical protein